MLCVRFARCFLLSYIFVILLLFLSSSRGVCEGSYCTKEVVFLSLFANFYAVVFVLFLSRSLLSVFSDTNVEPVEFSAVLNKMAYVN